jgi:hypothetical protein
VIAALEDRPSNDPIVKTEFMEIKDTVLEMKAHGWADLFSMGPERNFHRVVLGYVNQGTSKVALVSILSSRANSSGVSSRSFSGARLLNIQYLKIRTTSYTERSNSLPTNFRNQPHYLLRTNYLQAVHQPWRHHLQYSCLRQWN